MIFRRLLSVFTKGLQEDVERRTADQSVVMQTSNANFFGQTSKGGKQLRGNGALILTRDEISFLMALPRKEIVIPLNRVVSVSLPKSHLGKSIFKPLLRVEYDSLEGRDSVAWAVKEPGKWKTAIETARERSV